MPTVNTIDDEEKDQCISSSLVTKLVDWRMIALGSVEFCKSAFVERVE